jgi:hypothetical protein
LNPVYAGWSDLPFSNSIARLCAMSYRWSAESFLSDAYRSATNEAQAHAAQMKTALLLGHDLARQTAAGLSPCRGLASVCSLIRMTECSCAYHDEK